MVHGLDCQNGYHKMQRVCTDYEDETEETEVAFVHKEKTYSRSRCLYCGEVERDLLWTDIKKVEWKDGYECHSA